LVAAKAASELARSYLAKLKKEIETGSATEHTYRAALKELIESLRPDVIAINEPKRVNCGAPDFVVKKGYLIIGHIEAKDIGKSLDKKENSEQLKRYTKSLDNLILTDYLEFRWYSKILPPEMARLARLTRDGKMVLEKNGLERVVALLENFLTQPVEPIVSSSELSQRLAYLAHSIRDVIVEAFDTEKATNHLWNLRKAFASVLIPDMDQPQKTAEFADMYAQTIVYGLFAARCNHKGPEPFQRLGAAREIPKTNPFLRQLFESITGNALDEEPYVHYVDYVVQILDRTDIKKVLADFGNKTKQNDPVIHFYEGFLTAYDPELREQRGVYYTPEPVVSYIVHSVDYILKKHFGLGGGLADSSTIEFDRETYLTDHLGEPEKNALPTRIVHEKRPRVLILDPACGTGTFLYAVVDHIRSEFINSVNAGLWSEYVRHYLLPRIFGFELLMAPYAVAHFKLGMQLAGQDLPPELQKDWSYDFSSAERLGIYLTNTLEEAENPWKDLWGYEIIGREARAASVVKRDMPIMVVLGNPPYSGNSANSSWEVVDGKKRLNFIGKLIRNYYFVDGKPLNEKQPKWLQDDYVKFIRWAQWRIEETGSGVVGLITNHGYLDNSTFRGMRQQLMEAFNDIYILDLHGNAKKKEICPDGSKDENVFDIQQGVAIGIFVKIPERTGSCKVHHAELWGLREGKYSWLLSHDIESTKWEVVIPHSPYYLFTPQNVDLSKEYERGWKITNIFPVGNVGFVTARDRFVIDVDRDTLTDRISDFRDLRIEDHEFVESYRLKNTSSWNLSESRHLMAANEEWEKDLDVCLYRPFDYRYIYYSKLLLERPVYQIMRHMLAGDNIGITVGRAGQVIDQGTWNIIFCTRHITEFNLYRRGGNNLHPLYLYPATEENSSRQKFLSSADWSPGKDGRVPNLSPEFVADLAERLSLEFVSDGRGDLELTFGPEDIFDYIYAIFHSPTYRKRYEEFLKKDFPKVPLTSNVEQFRKLCILGRKLADLHLLESPEVSKFITHYPVKGDNQIERSYPKYVVCENKEPGDIYINKTQYFKGVPPEVWDFRIGGYQVAEKWLKDRSGRHLSFDDLMHYQKVIVALKETMRLMEEVDIAIPEWPIK